MATATERVQVLMTPAEKQRVVAKAQAQDMSVGEYLRQAAAGFRTDTDDQALEAMIDQMNQATANAEQAIDETLSFVAESNRRIDRMEAQANGEAA
ncbi:MAG: hypothetical protein KZQ89_15425 [Candidatus Thiodiazotropha sp. (ex Lucinoma kastoroae)]|nr:hypothetical protein [Candidatus Thiodiazotropha sp. (ex Lucinoma kastoroae)]MCU7859681.1 hypothetical protein [Candidatus Thiodiazotropha sp. (ex Lucinoma kastoroae)]